jgi:hypothetical protein
LLPDFGLLRVRWLLGAILVEFEMSKVIFVMLASLLFFISPATAQTCVGSLPNTLTNGTNADATQVMANFNYLLTCLNSLPPPTTAASSSSTRQTVAGGPVTTSGTPNFLPATAAGLSVTSANVSSTYPLSVTAANNNDPASGSQKDLIGFSTSNLTWASLTASTTNYLYVTVGTGGLLTTGSTTLAPIYQQGGTPATTARQFTFNIGEMRSYFGNGSTAPQANVVFVGEAVTSATAVTSTVAYAYNGQYVSAFTATLPGSGATTSVSHNLGVYPRVRDFIAQCTANDAGYAVGDQVSTSNGLLTATTIGFAVAIRTTPKIISATTVAGGGNTWYTVQPGGGGAASAINPANWQYMFLAQRGW